MALSQADFYAYSRATGAPVPEDPRERAEMAPEVLAFRRNQLKTPESQGPDPLSVGIGVGLAFAGAGGLAFGARRLMRGPKQSATAGIRQADLTEMAAPESPVRRAAAETSPEPSKVVSEPEYVSPYRKGPTYQDLYPSRFEYPRISPETIQARRQASAQSAAAAREARPSTYQLELGGEVSPTLRQIRSSEFGPNISPVRRDFLGLAQEEASSRPLTAAPEQLNLFTPRSYLEQTGSLAPAQDLTSVQQQSLPQVINQKTNAVESGANQQQLDIISEVQRNEDIDVSSAQQFLNNKRNQLQAQGLRPSQVENILAKDPNIKEGVELFASTGDIGALSRLSSQPASPIQLRATQQTGTPGTPIETVSTKQFYQNLPFGENVDYLVEQDIDLTNKISSLGAQQQQLPVIKAQLEEQANMAEFAMKQGGPTSDEALRVYSNTQYQLQNLPDYSADISEAINQRDYVRQQISSLEALGPKRQLRNVEEGFSITEDTGELIPKRLSVPAGVVEKPAAGSSIRGLTGSVEMESFIPEERMQAGTAAKEFAMGPRVGIEPERREAMLSRPVQWTPELYPAKRRTPEGYVYSEEAMRKPSVPVGKETALRREIRRPTPLEVARKSVDVSETIRRLQSSNRPDAQDQLRRFLEGLK